MSYSVCRGSLCNQVNKFVTSHQVVAPLVNPDGYHHTWTVDRLWRKTRRPSGSGDPTCVGTDVGHWQSLSLSFSPRGLRVWHRVFFV
jgi:extracellular matrix protein 14